MPNRKPTAATRSAAPREPVIEMVVRRIESLVRSGYLRRGSRLPSEPRLAEMLQVSRASLREALKGMVFIGLLKARAGDGTYLQPSLTSMATRHLQWMLLLEEINDQELYELREILEPAAAALAARRATPEDLDQMRAALNGMKLSMNAPESFIRYEMEFHNVIMRASKNGAMQSTMQMMYGALSEGRHRALPFVQNLAQHCARHERMFDLIAKHDATGARRAVVADVKYAESLLQQNMQAFAANGTRGNLKKAATAKSPAQQLRKQPAKKNRAKAKRTGESK